MATYIRCVTAAGEQLLLNLDRVARAWGGLDESHPVVYVDLADGEAPVQVRDSIERFMNTVFAVTQRRPQP